MDQLRSFSRSLQKVLFSLGGSFLYYADRFKLYSAFCASHTKVPKVLVKGKASEDWEQVDNKLSVHSVWIDKPKVVNMLGRCSYKPQTGVLRS